MIRVQFAPALLLALAATGCERTPAEPDPPATHTSSERAVAPLRWDVPGSWTDLDVPRAGPRRAQYKVPRVADDKAEAEVEVLFFGTGSQGDVETNIKAWLAQFDGDAGSRATRGAFEAHGLPIETVEASGTYTIGLGPASGPGRKSPVQMVKEGYRLLGAAVKTPDRGNWYFKLTGPDATVQSARSAFRTLLESAR